MVLAYNDRIQISSTNIYYGDGPPTNGDYNLGDLLIIVPTTINPTAASPLAYRCTTASSAHNGGSWTICGSGASRSLTSPTLTSSSTSFTLFVSDGTYTISAVSVTFGTASASGTMNVEIATGTQAIGSGTAVLTGTMSLAGTANTPVSGTLTSTTANLQVAAGNRINVLLAGSLTSLANCVVTVTLV
jgi:hypothetical protein